MSPPMETDLLLDLAWLPRPPENFGALCRAASAKVDLGSELVKLASYAHDDNGLARLAKLIAKARTNGESLEPLLPYRLAILSNATTDYLATAITATAARHGLALECIQGSYGQPMQDALSPDSPVNKSRPDAVLLAIDWRGLPLDFSVGNDESAAAGVQAAIDYLRAIQSGIGKASGAVCIFQTLAPPPETLFGSIDRLVSGTIHRTVQAVNAAMDELVRGSSGLLLDVSSLAAAVGLARWHSPAQWNLAKIPFDQRCLPLYAEHVCRLVNARSGRSRRCLVLDLDNTLWGGVIGDDGLGGIRLGQGDPAGEAYVDFQRYLLALRERGVVLAVSSKNEDPTARLPFREHPEMLIREEHIAVFQANWNDKPTNIRAIAEQLSLGLESFAFVDDNPFEREMVRRSLPQVAVPEMPEDPAYYVRTLSAAGLFESILFTDEDRKRAGYYAGNARRAALQSDAGDIESYLATLRMEITFQPFDETGRARIAQLINKSNQFNLTTRRYTEAEIARFESEDAFFTLQVRLSDVFGDNGMISVIFCRPTPENDWEFDLWLMSCRVLGRGVEKMALREVLRHARCRGIRNLIGVYIPSARNQLVERHYETLGFVRTELTADGRSHWKLPVDGPEPEAAPMTVRISGFGNLTETSDALR
jgi:FkbH-like protein